MKQFKKYDFLISAGLIVAYFIIVLIEQKRPFINNFYLIQGYFVVGAWQVISMIVHIIFKPWQQLSSVRKMYSCITLFCIITMFMGFLMLGILLYTAPIMAIFYTCICGVEVFAKVKRPLDQLK